MNRAGAVAKPDVRPVKIDGLAVLKDTFSEWSKDKASRLGAAVAYYTIFSIAPC